MIEDEITVDEAENADGDVIGVFRKNGQRKVQYHIQGKVIKQGKKSGIDVVGEVKKAIEQELLDLGVWDMVELVVR